MENDDYGKLIDEIESEHDGDKRTEMPNVPVGKDGFVADCITQIINEELVVNCEGFLYFYNVDAGYFEKVMKRSQAEAAVFRLFSENDQIYLTRSHVQDILYRLSNLSCIRKPEDFFYTGDRYVNARNGVVDTKEKKLYKGDKKLYFNYCINADYIKKKKIKCPALEKFFRTSLDNNPVKILLFLEVLGFLLVPTAQAKKAVFFIGKRHSGKSTIGRLLTHLIGIENMASVPIHELDTRFANSMLETARLNAHLEMDSKPLSSIAAFKAITGNDTVKTEGKGTELRNLRYRTKLFFAGNSLPGLKNVMDIDFFIDRIVLLYFGYSIPKEEWDKKLDKKLIKEANGIFTLAMNQYSRLRSRQFRFLEPDDSTQILKAYCSESNTMASFVNEGCQRGRDYKQHSVVLYKAYTIYCKDNLLQPLSPSSFSRQLGVLLDTHSTTINIKGVRLKGFKEIDLKALPVTDSAIPFD